MVFDDGARGRLAHPAVAAEHVGFGSILGADGKILRTRAGESVKLVDLLDEAVARAADGRRREATPTWTPRPAAAIARAVGIGAVKYADLSSDRDKDYVFDCDRMLSLRRQHRALPPVRARPDPVDLPPGRCRRARAAGRAVTLAEPAERALALELLGFPQVVGRGRGHLEFHQLAGYLYGLAAAFTGFYENCPVLRAEEPTRSSRLALCDLTARTLALGLDLLGIAAPHPM